MSNLFRNEAHDRPAALYDGIADRYARSRPGYPIEAVKEIAHSVASEPVRLAVDVGSGTGIFTRMLALELGPEANVISIEPNPGMRERAQQEGRHIHWLTYRAASAERLPLDRGAVDLVTAAGAAHLFDRPSFFYEALRILSPRGGIALLQNKRVVQGENLFAAFELFLERFVPGYTTGTYADRRGSYSTAPFEAEMRAGGLFKDVRISTWSWQTEMRGEDFKTFALSTIHLHHALRANGEASVMRELEEVIADHIESDGLCRLHYSTEVTSASPTH